MSCSVAAGFEPTPDMRREESAFQDSDILHVDLISYLARRLDVPHEAALAKLGNWLVDPPPDARREQYARALRGQERAR